MLVKVFFIYIKHALVKNNQLKYQREFSYSTTAIITLYTTTTVMLQFNKEESSRLHHIQLYESLQNI